ncbi:MAG: S-methyl-5-thioribose-1-phosphate isomerase [Pirellulales bacterium]
MARAFDTLRWEGQSDGRLVLLDQTRLPLEQVEITCRTVEDVWEAIRSLRVRGAPAIGVAAAYGVCIAAQTSADDRPQSILDAVASGCERLATSRPTAVNLFWALDRMRRTAERLAASQSGRAMHEALLAEAHAIAEEDRRMCDEIGRIGAELLSDGQGVLTHCNAGALATAGSGTALAVITAAHRAGKRLRVFVDETRPLLQGSRLTAWELLQEGVPATLICDNAACHLMGEGRVQAVVTGADRIAACGDVANKIGTYAVAVAAAAHDIPFYVAAPTSTFDLSIESGRQIPIEQRAAGEVTCGLGKQTAPDGVEVYNPAFDVTPARLIRAIITERGLIEPVTAQRIAEVVGGRQSSREALRP